MSSCPYLIILDLEDCLGSLVERTLGILGWDANAKVGRDLTHAIVPLLNCILLVGLHASCIFKGFIEQELELADLGL